MEASGCLSVQANLASSELALSLARASKRAPLVNFEPVTPALAGTEAETERVELITSDKVNLKAVFYIPKDASERAPAALLVHDAGSSGESLTPIAEYLNKRGFGVLVLDLRGHGESATDSFKWENLGEEERERVWAMALDDVQAGAEWLRKRSDIHSSNLTVLGVRASCALVARHAVNDENARAAVLVAPEARVLGFDLMRDLRSLGGLPTLILVEKTGRQEAVRMTEASHSANGGEEYIKVQYLKCKADRLVSDSKLKSNLNSWLREQVMPHRGR